jgi:hypothetical protein
MQQREKVAARNERLSKTPEGKALLDLVHRFDSRADMAKALGIQKGLIACWVNEGRISRAGAQLVSEKLMIDTSAMRPDLDAKAWEAKPPGRRINEKSAHDNHDQRLLISLADHYGSVIKFCAAAEVKPDQYRSWKSRGRIAAWVLPRLCRLDGITDELRAWLLEVPR